MGHYKCSVTFPGLRRLCRLFAPVAVAGAGNHSEQGWRTAFPGIHAFGKLQQAGCPRVDLPLTQLDFELCPAAIRRLDAKPRELSKLSPRSRSGNKGFQGPSKAAGITAIPSLRRYALGPVVMATASSRLPPIFSFSQRR